MKRFTLTAIALMALSLTAWSCNAEKKTDGKADMQKTAPAKTEAAATAEPAYPLDVCVVSGQKLGSMGEPVIVEHEGRKVKLCCQGCVAAFEKEPAKYIAKLDEAAKPAADPHAGHNH